MNKIISSMFLIVLTVGLAHAAEPGANEIAFIKQKLLNTPREQLLSNANTAIAYLSTIGLSALFDCCLRKIIQQINIFHLDKRAKLDPNQSPKLNEDIRDWRENFSIYSSLTAIPWFILIYFIINHIILRKLEKANFLKFVKEWEFNKQLTPKELRYSFDNLHSEYQKTEHLNSRKVHALKIHMKKLIEQTSFSKEIENVEVKN